LPEEGEIGARAKQIAVKVASIPVFPITTSSLMGEIVKIVKGITGNESIDALEIAIKA
jgi:hypothetical protein